MSKKFLMISVALAFVLSLALNPVWAKNQSNNQDESILPEQEGVYDVPGHPDLKVRVFIHRVKPTSPPPPEVRQCSLPDDDCTTSVGGAGWTLPSENWNYTLNPSSVPATIDSADLGIMAADAFGRWSIATGDIPKVTFSRTADTTKTKAALDGKNIITWGRAPGSALAITYIWSSRITGLVTEFDTIMNTKFPWRWSNPALWSSPETTCADQNSYDAQSVLTHELGHWLGLDDFYDDIYINATMYGYGAKGEIKGTTLSTGDINGIKAIYP